MSWTKQDIKRLIKEFKKEEGLWNNPRNEYGRQRMRIECWQRVAQVMDRPVHEVKRKIASVLSSYRRIAIQERRYRGKTFTTSWPYYKHLRFMKQRQGSKRPTASLEDEQSSCASDDDDLEVVDAASVDEDTSWKFSNGDVSISISDTQHGFEEEDSNANETTKNNFEDSSKFQIISSSTVCAEYEENSYTSLADMAAKYQLLQNSQRPDTEVNQSAQTSHTVPSAPCPQPMANDNLHFRESSQVVSQTAKEAPVKEPLIQSSETSTTKPQVQQKDKDECGLYADYIACKLSSYSERVKNIVQHQINNIIFEADMGKLG